MFGFRRWYVVTHPHELIRGIHREIRWAWQRVIRGWDDRALWSMDYWLAKKMLEMLPKMKEKAGIPGFCFSEDDPCGSLAGADEIALAKWHGIIDQMIDGFEACLEMLDADYRTSYEDSHKRYHEGMEAFVEDLFSLWD